MVLIYNRTMGSEVSCIGVIAVTFSAFNISYRVYLFGAKSDYGNTYKHIDNLDLEECFV
jgi:hypothetical protein